MFLLCILLYMLTHLRCKVIMKNEGGNKVAYLQEGIIEKKESVKWLVIPAEVTVIPEETFKGCENLTKINFPKTLQRIEKNAFYGCYRLEYLRFPETLNYIGDAAFKNCKSLTDIYFPENILLEEIGEQAFYNTNLIDVELPAKTSKIGKEAFYSCDNLQSILLPSAYFKYGYEYIIEPSKDLSIFSGYENYKESDNDYIFNVTSRSAKLIHSNSGIIPTYVIKDNLIFLVDEIGDNVFKNQSIETLILPKYLYRIGNHAFENATIKNEIEFPSTLKIIGDYSFKNCSCNKLDLPEELYQIGSYAFEGQTSLIVPSSVKFIKESGLAGINEVQIKFGLDIEYTTDLFGIIKNNETALKKCLLPLSWQDENYKEILGLEYSNSDIIITFN